MDIQTCSGRQFLFSLVAHLVRLGSVHAWWGSDHCLFVEIVDETDIDMSPCHSGEYEFATTQVRFYNAWTLLLMGLLQPDALDSHDHADSSFVRFSLFARL